MADERSEPSHTETGDAVLIINPRSRILFVVRVPSPPLPPTIATMSGFEVVGVVLGSIPLLITALERYRDGVRTEEG